MFRPARISDQTFLRWLPLLFCMGIGNPCLAKPAYKSQVVLLLPPGEGSETSRFADNLKWQLDELGLGLVTSETELPFELERYVSLAKTLLADKQATMALWVVGDREQVVMYLFDLKDQTLRERPMSTNASPFVAAEELAIMARSAIVAHLEGKATEPPEKPHPPTIANLRKDAPIAAPNNVPSPTVGAPQPEERSPWRFALRGGFETTAALKGEGLQPAIKVAVHAGYRRFYAELGYSLYGATTLRSNWAEIALYRHPAELNLGYAVYQSRSWVAAECFSTLDRWRRETKFTTEPLAPTEQTRSWVASLGLRLRGAAPLTSTLAATFGAGATYVLNPQRFETALADHHENLGQLARFYPALDANLIWYFN